MVTSEFYQSVFLISYKNAQGTAFTINYKGSQYLVSSFHIFENSGIEDLKEIDLTIFNNEEWKSIVVRPHLPSNLDLDVIVFTMKGFLSHKIEIPLGIGGLITSQDVFFLGFPYGLFSADKENLNRNFPFPFVKKSICSALNMNTYEGSIIYLDGHTNPGFSGGPVIFKEFQSNKMKILGIMMGYIIHKGKIEFEEVDEEGNVEADEIDYDENSGIIKVLDIKHALQIIDNIK